MRILLAIVVVVVLIYLVAQIPSPRNVDPHDPVLNAEIRAHNQRVDAQENFKLKNFTWSKSEFGVMTASFTFDNQNDFDIKDVTVRCDHSAPSGTTIDSNTRTIYEVFKAKSQRTISNFNMGLIHSQARSSSCRVADLAIGEARRPVAPPAAKKGSGKDKSTALAPK